MDDENNEKKIVNVTARGITTLYKAMLPILFYHRQLARFSDEPGVKEALEHIGRSYDELIAALALINVIFHREIGAGDGEQA